MNLGLTGNNIQPANKQREKRDSAKKQAEATDSFLAELDQLLEGK